MSCPLQHGEGAELLLAYCARRLDEESRAWLERHMDLCPQCRSIAQQQAAVWEALDYWDALAVSEDFDARVRQRIRFAERGDHLKSRGLWRALRVPLAVASILLGALMLVRLPTSLHPAPELAGPAEVDSAEAALEDIELLRTLELTARAQLPRVDTM